MATSNSRDVKMTLSVETLGSDDIKKLQASVAALAKEGGAAAPEFELLADHIGRLADQSAALAAFQALANETADLAANQRAAATAADEYATKLQEAAAATQAASAVQRTTAAALEEARAAQKAARDELDRLRASTDAAGKAEKAYGDEVTRLKLAKIEQRSEIERLDTALKQSNRAVADAQAAETLLEGSYKRAAAAAKEADAAVTAHQNTLQGAAASAEALGVSTTNVAASQAALIQALNAAGQAALSAKAEVDKLVRAEEELAAQNAFQKQADDAKRLFDTASYAELFEQALQKVAVAERAVVAAQGDLDWQREADAIVNATEATQKLVRQQEIMLEVQRQLANDRAMAQVADDAERLARQADQVRLFTQVLDDLEEKERAAGAAAKEAGDRINNAFGQVGVRSVEVLRAEIAQVRAAMETLKSSAGLTGGALDQAFASGQAKIKALERDIRDATGALTLADRAADAFKNSLGQIAAGNVIADGVGYLVNKIKELGREFLEVTVQTERMRKGLQAVYKDSAIAAQQFQFLRDTANASGFSIGATSDAFLRFSAATKSANLPLSVTNDLFTAVTRAGTTLGLTGDQVTGTLDALGQMASKGVVSMEELRQQLGDRLPGALSLAAQGLGITDQQLIKLVESGQLATQDFFPAFTAGLRTMAGDTDTLSSAWQRFTNMLNEFSVGVGDAGGLDVMKMSLQALGAVLSLVLVPLQGFVEMLGLAGSAIGRFIGALTTGDFKGAFDGFSKQVDAAATRMTRFHKALYGVVTGTQDAGAATASNAVIMGKSATATLSAAAATERLAAGTAASGSAFVQQIVKLQENATATEAAVTASEKLLKAKQEEGKGLVLTANLTGNASKALDANSTAAAANVVAAEGVFAARQKEANITLAAIDLINQQRDAQGRLNTSRQGTLDKLNATLVVQEAELEKSKQATFELGRQALAASAAAAAYADNTTKVEAYKAAMEDSQGTAELLTAQIARQAAAVETAESAYKAGIGTLESYAAAKANLAALTDQLTKATGEAAKNENLYRDAVADSVKSVERKARAEQATLQVSMALAKAQQAHYESLAKEAAARGDQVTAMEFAISAKQREIKGIELAIQMKQLEAKADAAAIDIQIAALDPQDKLYKQKLQELEIRKELIKVKLIEADTQKEVVKQINAEIDAMRLQQSLKGGSVTTIGGPDQAPPGERRDQQEQSPGVRQSNGQENFGRSGDNLARGKNGAPGGQFTNLTPFDKAFDVMRSKGEGMSIDELRAAKKQADDGKAWLDGMAKSGGGTSIGGDAWRSIAGLQAATSSALDKAIRAQKSDALRAKAAAEPSGGNKTVTVNIGGKSTPINVAGAADSDALVGVLRQLENASGTAS